MARGKARSRYLPAGTTLHGAGGKSWRIEPAEAWRGVRLVTPAWVIGAGGFGITYRVVSEPGGEVMALKEYFPEDFADRASDGAVSARTDDTGVHTRLFAEGLRKFSNEAQYLQELQHPNICRVVDAFMANGTAYYVSELVEGRAAVDEAEGRIHRRVTLHDYLAELEGAPDPLTLDKVRPLIDQLLDAVDYVHTEGPAVVLRVLGFETRTLLHRDIKPSNILVRPAPDKLDAGAAEVLSDPGTVVQLIDFGSARGMAVEEGEGNTKSVAFITDSYAPPELKDNRISEQGPQSDIYSLAATFWRILIGKQPAMTDLIGGVRAVNIGEGRAPPAFLSGLDNALQMDPRARPRSVAAWRELLFRPEAKTVSPGTKRAARSALILAGIAAGVVAVIVLGLWIIGQTGGPTDHVYGEADAAYQQALSDVSAGEDASATAQSHIDMGDAAAEEAYSASGQALYNVAEKTRIETPRVVSNLLMNHYSGGVYQFQWYCRLDPNGNIERTYDGAMMTCSRSMGSTSTLPGGVYAGPTTPWSIDIGSSTYEGHVDGGTPTSAGVLRNGDAYLALRIGSVSGQTVSGLGTGRLMLAGSWHNVTGSIATTSGDAGLIPNSIEGSVGFWPDQNSWLTGRWTPQESVGTFRNVAKVIALGRRSSNGAFSGRVPFDDGRTFIGYRPVGDGLWWGALTRSGTPYYLGQVRDGAPEGCGVRIGDDGKRRGVYVVNGLEDPDAFRPACSDISFSPEVAQ